MGQVACLSQLLQNYLLGSVWLSLLVAACESSLVESSARLHKRE